MFGRRATGFGSKAPPSPPPSDWLSFDKMDAALDAAIRLFTHALDAAGQDCGALAIRGPKPAAVAQRLADCIVYPGEGGEHYLTLGLTRDFKAFSYQPHCQLFLILNAVLILEDLPDSPLRAQIAVSQVPQPLVHAHMMKRWIKFIRPVGRALTQGEEVLTGLMRDILTETREVARLVPGWIAERVDCEAIAHEWCLGFPGTIGRPIDADVQPINDLPMSEFVAQLITDFLARTQAQGLMERRAV